MKNVFLLSLIMIICGSVRKAPIQPCSTMLVTKQYLNGKLVHYCTREGFNQWGYVRKGVCVPDKNKPHKDSAYFDYDSISITVKINKP